MIRVSRAALAAILLCLACVNEVVALPVTVTLTQVTRGWYNEAGSPSGGDGINYIAGDGRGPACGCSSGDFRNYFVFDMSTVTTPIVGGELALFIPSSSPGFASPQGVETYSLFNVTTSLAALTGGSGGLAAHADLGSGVAFGSRAITAADLGMVVTIPLNAAAIAALDAATGQIGLGGAITTLDGVANDEYAFGWTNSPLEGLSELRLTLLPEPSAGVFLLSAWPAAVAIRRAARRRLRTTD